MKFSHFAVMLLAVLFVLSSLSGAVYAAPASPKTADGQSADMAPYGSVLTRDLSQGMTGADVAALQSMLFDLGYLTEDLSGCFDAGTKAAVIAFQKDHPALSADGVVNRDTCRELNKVLSGREEQPDCLIYDSVIPVGSSYTPSPIFSDGQDHTVTLSSDSPLVNITGMTINALYPGSTEISAKYDDKEFKFFVVIRTEAEIAERVGNISYANNLSKGIAGRMEELASWPLDTDSMILIAGDCYLDERLFLTDLYESRFPDSNVCSIALSGSTAKQWQTYIQDVYPYQPSSLLLCVGMNDLRHKSTVPTAIRNLEKLLDAIRENMPDTTVYWWNIMPHIGSPEQYYKIAAVNAAIKEKYRQDSNVIVVDVNAVLSDENGIADPDLFLDTLHPNSEGYDLLFQAQSEASGS